MHTQERGSKLVDHGGEFEKAPNTNRKSISRRRKLPNKKLIEGTHSQRTAAAHF